MTESSVFQAPPDPSIRIWRYMDFTKYVAMLDHAGLFFPRATELDDPFEGSLTQATQTLRSDLLKGLGVAEQAIRDINSQSARFAKWNRQWVMINSWHMNESESAAMWKLYARTEEAVCVQSTFDRLRNVLPSGTPLSIVKYIDYDTEWMPDGNVFYPFLHKRLSFAHERELRALRWDPPTTDTGIDWSAAAADSGEWVSADLSALVERVLVAPAAPTWFLKLVDGVSTRYGLTARVVQSDLDKEPFF